MSNCIEATNEIAVSNKGSIYAIATESMSYVKFGWTNDVHRRLYQIQTGCPEKAIVVQTAKWNRAYEKAIHRMLSHRQSNGEWFIGGSEVDRVIEMMRKNDTSELDALVKDIERRDYSKSHRCLTVTKSGIAALTSLGVFNRTTQVMFSLVLESNLLGKALIHPDEIASRLGMDSSDVRKSLKLLEERGVIRRDLIKNQGHVYWLNPRIISSQTEEASEGMHAIWSSESRSR